MSGKCISAERIARVLSGNSILAINVRSNKLIMNDFGPATEHEMVLAFLKAEIDSIRYGPVYEGIFSRWQLDRTKLIDQPDLSNSEDDQIRIELLKIVRGYKLNKALFKGFPSDIEWRRAALEPAELTALKYANIPLWTTLSGGSRSVADGAANIDRIPGPESVINNIRAVADKIMNGHRFPELIAVRPGGDDLILVEGHTRATAYILVQPSSPIELLVGSSPLFNKWAFY